MKIKLAPQNLVDEFHDEVSELLKIIGFPSALVTNESLISDFACFVPSERQKSLNELCKKVSEHCNFYVHDDEYLVDIAKRLKESRRACSFLN